jgi:hypothetical protein
MAELTKEIINHITRLQIMMESLEKQFSELGRLMGDKTSAKNVETVRRQIKDFRTVYFDRLSRQIQKIDKKSEERARQLQKQAKELMKKAKESKKVAKRLQKI